jgi:hypothetical protein
LQDSRLESRPSLFWDVMWRRLIFEDGTDSCSETSETNYYPTRNIPKARSPQRIGTVEVLGVVVAAHSNSNNFVGLFNFARHEIQQ